MKKFVGLALLGLVAFNSCNQGLNVNEKSETVAVARAYIDDEVAFTWQGITGTFEFKNGKTVSGTVEGFENKNGEIKLDFYFTKLLNHWKRDLDAAGIPYRYEASSNPFRFCHMWFASDLVKPKQERPVIIRSVSQE